MDLTSGISSVVQALQIAKSLKDFDNTLDNAEFKLAIADLTEKLADAKISLSDAKMALNEKDAEIRQLREQIENSSRGGMCPLCNVGRMKVVSSRPHPVFHHFGTQEDTIKCQSDDCGHTEKVKRNMPKD